MLACMQGSGFLISPAGVQRGFSVTAGGVLG